MDLIFSLITKFFIYSVFLFSLNNIVTAKSGFWAVGQISFFCIGALTTAVLSTEFNFSSCQIYLTFIISIGISVLISLILSISTIRLKGDFFIFISICIAQLCNTISEQLGGPSGYSGIIRPIGIQSDFSFMIFSLTLFIIVLLYILHFQRHPINQIYSLIRTSEQGASSFGINILKFRLNLFIFGGIIATISGILFAFCTNGTDPQRFSLNEAIILFALAIFGGMDSIKGSVVAAIFYVMVIQILDTLFSGIFKNYATPISTMIFGLVLLLVIRFKPEGLFGRRIF